MQRQKLQVINLKNKPCKDQQKWRGLAHALCITYRSMDGAFSASGEENVDGDDYWFIQTQYNGCFRKSIYRIDQLSNVLGDRTRKDLVFHCRSLNGILSSFLLSRGLIIAMIWYLE